MLWFLCYDDYPSHQLVNDPRMGVRSLLTSSEANIDRIMMVNHISDLELITMVYYDGLPSCLLCLQISKTHIILPGYVYGVAFIH